MKYILYVILWSKKNGLREQFVLFGLVFNKTNFHLSFLLLECVIPASRRHLWIPDNNISRTFSSGFSISDFTSRKYRTNSQPEVITAPIVAIQRNINLHIKIRLCTHVSGFWFCMCYYNFKDYLVYFLQGSSLTCPLRPGFLLLPVRVKKMPFYICRKQVVVVITILALWNLSKVIGLRIPFL